MRGGECLVDGGTRRYGRFGARPANLNPLDEFSGLSRPLRRLRLKEWAGFTLVHPGWFSSLIMQDANYLASSEMYACERATGALYQHAATAGGGSLRMPATLPGSKPVFRKSGYRLEYEFSADGAPHRLRIDIAATAKAPAFRGELELHGDRASTPLSVSHKMPGGKLYTHKAVFPASGALRVGDAEIVFDPARDLAILDEHKSFLPYRTNWLWGTFAAQGTSGVTGANLCARPALPGEEEESCLWVPGACEPLADVTFTPSGTGTLQPWHVVSADGRMDVTFTPEGRKGVRHQLGLFEIDYFQLYGTYRGTMRGLDGTGYTVDGTHGVLESMRARL